MLMRGFVALLLILNGAMLAWQWELFAPWGWMPHTAREPERVLNQIRPDAIRVETPAVTAKRLADAAAQTEMSADATAATATTTATSTTVNVSATNLPATAAPAPAATPKSSAPPAPPSTAVVKPPATVPADNASKPTKVTAP